VPDADGQFLPLSHPGGIQQHPSGPAVDVEVAYQGAHAAHSLLLFIFRHEERLIQSLGSLLHMVGVDDQRLVQLVGGAGKLAEDQHPPLVVTGRHILLGHQVHAVMEAGDHADLRCPVIAVHLFRFMVLGLEDDGLVSVTGEALVNPLRQGVHPHVANADLHQVVAAHRLDNVDITQDSRSAIGGHHADILGTDAQDDLASSGTIRATIIATVPIALAGLGGLWSERAGVVNIGLEGMMILGTFGAGFLGYHYGPWAGVLGAIALGAIGGLIHAVATVVFGVDHIISGVAINIIALGATQYLAALTFTGLPGGGQTQSPTLGDVNSITIEPLSDALGDIEGSGIFFVSELAAGLRALVTELSLLVLLALLLFVLTYFVLWRTAFGLRLRSCGESPAAAETLGVNVYRYKFIAVLVSGGLAGLGGGFLAMVASSNYRDGQTGGRGYIGLAAMIFGNWRPGGLLAGSGLFGYTETLGLRRGGESVHALLILVAALLVIVAIWQWRRLRHVSAGVAAVIALGAAALYYSIEAVPGDFTRMTPYVTTLFVLAFASQRLRMPAADGQIYRRGTAG